MRPFLRAERLTPPKAEPRPIRREAHGLSFIDDYDWIRAENWRDVLQNPEKLGAEIKTLLEAENAYTEAVLEEHEELTEKILQELTDRVDENDCDPPAADGAFAYYRRYREDGQHELVCRQAAGGGREEIILDGDAEAEGKDFFKLHAAAHAPNHALLAWSRDERGNELHSISCRNLTTGADSADIVENTDGAIVWMRDSQAFLYTRVDDDFRTAQVFRHVVGADAETDELVFEEPDPGWFVHLRAARSRAYAIVTVSDHDSSECWLIDLADAKAPVRLVLPRRAGLRYDVEPGRDRLYMRTNADGAFDFKLVSHELADLNAGEWREEVPHRPGQMIFNATIFADYLVWLEREDCRPRLVVRSLTGDEHIVAFDAPCHHLRLEPNFAFDEPVLRLSYSSLTTPEEIYDYHLATRVRTLLKRQNIPSGHDERLYDSRLEFATAPDGEKVPLSLVWRKDRAAGPGPALLYGYGAYGSALPDSFDESRFSLIDRGFIYAIAHVRGGSEKGSRWYESGKFEHKPNTFSDFLACARHLCALGLTAPGRIIAEGGSAGGLLIGAVVNQAPELFAGVIAEVPFVDVVNTIMDDSLPLTPPEWNEWGNPIRDAAVFRTMLAYSPYDNVKPQAYPPMLIEAGLTDPRVTYWEPAKWTQRLRARMIGGGPILLKTSMEAGHGGASGRYDELDDIAVRQAFALAAVGKA